MPPAEALPAIPARHIPIAQEIIYRALVLPACRAQFGRIWLRLAEPVPHPADGPLIVYLNHTGWWDAYMLFLIYYQVLGGGFRNYIMMEEQQLRPYRFFSWCGAFSINRQRPGDAERAVAYATARLRESRRNCLWIFPQGKIVPNDRRPLVLYPGLARVVQQAGRVTLWPVGLRYEFRGTQHPEAFISAGPAHTVSADTSEAELTASFTARLTGLLDGLRDNLLAGQLSDYRVLMRGRLGIDQTFDRLLARVRRPGARGRPE